MIDLSKLSTQQVERFIRIQSAIGRQSVRQVEVKTYRDYYYGEHPVLLTLRQKEFLGGLLTDADFPFQHNLCRIVIDTIRERLNLSGVSVNGQTLDDSVEEAEVNLAAIFWSWWEDSQMDLQQQRAYRRCVRDGRSYVTVDYDGENMRPRFRLHKVDDGVSGMVFHRDPEDPQRVLFANKYSYTAVDYSAARDGSAFAATATTGIPRRTTYLPHEIRKYIMGKSGEWKPYQEPDDISWPIPWVDRQGRALGILAFELENPGGSELRDIIGFQNAANKSWIDLIAAADMSGFPTGVIEYPEGILDDLNQASDENLTGADEVYISPGRALELFDGASYKRIEAASLSPMIETIWAITQGVSSVTKVPAHHFKPLGSTANMSGEALKQLESPLIKRVNEKQIAFGQTWKDVFAFAYKLEQTFGRLPESDERISIAPHWESPEIEDRKSNAEVAKTERELGVPDSEVYATLGYSPEQIAEFASEARRAQTEQIATIAGALRVNETRSQQQTNPERNGRL